MRFLSVFSGPFRWLAPFLCLVACVGVASAQTTTFTGTVYSPLGPPNSANPNAVHGDPVPNILVFAADPNSPLPVFSQGVTIPQSGQNGCAAQPSLVPVSVLGEALTDYTGTYTFTTSGALPTPSVNIVIQAGKWRLQTKIPTTSLTLGKVNTLAPLSMPSAQSSVADLPHIAIVTGESDAIECIFNQIGISNSEITDPGGSGSINLFEGESTGGEVVSSSSPAESTLVSSVANLSQYDLVMFGCQGGTGDDNAPLYANNLTDYTSYGGRIFGTHFEYIWLKDNTTFNPVATWSGSFSGATGVNYPATINTSGFQQGTTLADWMNYIGALSSFTPTPTVELSNVRQNTTAVNLPAVSWANLVPAADSGQPLSVATYSGTPSMQFTFDTPIGAAGTPTVAITYTNNTTSFYQGDASDNITLVVTNNSTTATTPGLTLAISLPGGITVNSLADNSGGAWTCTQTTPTATCTLPTALAPGAFDSVLLTFSIAPTASVGQVSLSASLSNGGLNNSQQCGRVLFNDYHVEQPRTDRVGQLYSSNEACPSQTTLTNAQKFLEYSLYNLSNFVSPSTTDLIDIQGVSTIAWQQPAPIEYGIALSSMQLDATATDTESNTSIPGTFVYTPPAGTVPTAGNVTLSVAFTPTVTADYTSATDSVILDVTQDPTSTTLIVSSTDTTPGVATPIYYGQIIGDTAVEAVISDGPGAIDGGNMLYYIDGKLTCTLTANAGGICPPPTGQGYNAGTHTTYSMYSGDANFQPSSSPIYTVVVQPDPTQTTVTSSAGTTTPPGQSITFTANVADTYYSPVSGTITFYDGTAVLGSVPASAASSATFTTANLTIGVHSITACFVSATNSSGTQNFKPSCSAPFLETISLPNSASPTTTILTSSINPSVVGESVTFTATTATTGAFISTPSGNVNFYDGTNLIGNGILTNGVAILTTSTLTAGLHNITAAYLGNATTAPSTSAILAQQVNVGIASAGTGFLMSVSPTTFSVGVGSSVSVVVSILELNNFNTPVTLSCGGLPAEATCTFSQSTIPATGGSTPLTISVAAPHTCGTNTPYFVADGSHTGLPILAGALLLFFARRRRVLKGLLLAAVICILPAISGCSNCTDLGVKPGVYTFTVIGSATGAVPVTVAVPATGAVPGPSTTTQTQTMTMTVTI